MSLNSVEIAISDVVARVADPAERRRAEEILNEADERVGGHDGRTSETEARDYFAVVAPWIVVLDEQPAKRALEILAAVPPPAEMSARGRAFVEQRTAFTRITHEMRRLQGYTDVMPTDAEAAAIRRLEGELRQRVQVARELAKDPQFASIAGYANAAIVRIASVRAWGVFEDGAYRTPDRLEPTDAASPAWLRFELGGVRAASAHIRFTEYVVRQGPPVHVQNLVATLHDIRGNIEQLQANRDAAQLGQLIEDFNTTLRVVSETPYKQRIRGTATTTANMGDLELPRPLAVSR